MPVWVYILVYLFEGFTAYLFSQKSLCAAIPFRPVSPWVC